MKAWIRLKIIVFGIWLITIALGGEYEMPPPGSDIIGQNYIYTISRGDSLTSIRQKHAVSYHELLEANPKINFYRLRVGQKIIIPKQFILPKFRRGIVINVAELRLYYFSPDDGHVYTYPIGLGRPGWRTPLAATQVVNKEEDPVWRVPKDIHDYVLNKTGEDLPEVVYPGPKNPLGKYALYLGKSGYLIHGTNAPTSVGTFISSGCMRLLREPIEELYEEVAIGTPVRIINYPNKAGWLGNKLYLESHKPVGGYPSVSSELNNLSAESAIYEATKFHPARVNWTLISQTTRKHTGIPTQVGYSF